MHIWSRFVNLGMDGEGCGVDGLITNDDLAFFIYKNQIAHADE